MLDKESRGAIAAGRKSSTGCVIGDLSPALRADQWLHIPGAEDCTTKAKLRPHLRGAGIALVIEFACCWAAFARCFAASATDFRAFAVLFASLACCCAAFTAVLTV